MASRRSIGGKGLRLRPPGRLRRYGFEERELAHIYAGADSGAAQCTIRTITITIISSCTPQSILEQEPHTKPQALRSRYRGRFFCFEWLPREFRRRLSRRSGQKFSRKPQALITERAGRDINLTRLGAGANAGVEIRLR